MVDTVVYPDDREHFEADYAFIEHLNQEGVEWARMDTDLQSAMEGMGIDWYSLVKERCPHLFAATPVFISHLHLQQMREVIAAVEEVVGYPDQDSALGVFYGYDFHLNEQGAHLIEINSNAGGGFLNALLVNSQRQSKLYGVAVADNNIVQTFIEMFQNEWRLEKGELPLKNIAIVDEHPSSQYLYPEFLLAKTMLEGAGIVVHIVDPTALQEQEHGLYCNGQRIDLIYNRLTDFDLQYYSPLREAWEKRQVVLTPNPKHYKRYADKRKLVHFSDGELLRATGISQVSINSLLRCVPTSRLVNSQDSELWWLERKQWFFKPVSGYGGKGAYRGEKLTKRVFEEIMQSDYIAQKLMLPGERSVWISGSDPQIFKYDVRCYVYAGHIQLVAARLYQGQTTNFRTRGGGFAIVREVR